MAGLLSCETCGALLSRADVACVRCGATAEARAPAPRVSSSRGLTVIPARAAHAHDAKTSPALPAVTPRVPSTPPGAVKPANRFSDHSEGHLQLDTERLRARTTPSRAITAPVFPVKKTRWLDRLLGR